MPSFPFTHAVLLCVFTGSSFTRAELHVPFHPSDVLSLAVGAGLLCNQLLWVCKIVTCFVHISQTVDWIDLQLFEHVSIIIMHLPIENFWSMDARISRKTKNGWRWWRPISWKPCTGIFWNHWGMLPSSICISSWNSFSNGCTDIEKMQKWLKVTEANFLVTVLEFAEIVWGCYHHSYASPYETVF